MCIYTCLKLKFCTEPSFVRRGVNYRHRVRPTAERFTLSGCTHGLRAAGLAPAVYGEPLCATTLSISTFVGGRPVTVAAIAVKRISGGRATPPRVRCTHTSAPKKAICDTVTLTAC